MPHETMPETLATHDQPSEAADAGPPSKEPTSWKGNLVESIRARPGMWVGDVRNSTHGLHEMLWTLLRWVVEQHVAGACTALEVMIDRVGGVTVSATGVRVETGQIEALLFGTKRDLHLVVVTALSTSVRLSSVPATGNRYEYVAEGGKALGVDPFFVDTSPVRTRIYFSPDPVFFVDTTFDYKVIEQRLREVSFINDQLRVSFWDERTRSGMDLPVWNTRGTVLFVDFLREGAVSLPIMHIFAGRGPTPLAAPASAPITVDFALCWRRDGVQAEGLVRSFANQHETKDGGHHVARLVRAARASVLSRIARTKALTTEERTRVARWLKEQMIAVIAITHPDPSFGGACRSILVAPEVGPVVEAEVRKVLDGYFDTHPAELVALFDAALAAPR